MSWVNQYVGIPYADQGREQIGLDCWGLVRLVYQQELGIVLPGFEDTYETSEDPGDLLARAWDVWQAVETPGEFDALLFWTDHPGLPTHVALSIGGRRFLHCFHTGCLVCDLDHRYWKRRYIGAYRYVA